MKNRKKVTPAVLAANRANAQLSTGPRTEAGKSHSSLNALQHGLLCKKVALETKKERKDFQGLLQTFRDEFRPKGVLESYLVEEIAIQIWKMRIALRLETHELSLREESLDRVNVFGDLDIFDKDLKLPIDSGDLPIDRGWECERIIVRAVAAHDRASENASQGPTLFQNQIINAIRSSQNHTSENGSHLEFEAVLGTSLEKLTRYQSSLKKDLYRAIELLRTLQRERSDS